MLADVKEDALAAEAEKLRAAGHKAFAVRCDVSDDAQVRLMVERTVTEFGRLDAAFNNAGVMAKMVPTADRALEEFERVIRVNLQGVWSCMKHELRQMERQGSGAVVNCSSIGGVRGDRGIEPYTASKHGVIGLTRAAALDYAPQGVRVNAVCPGTIDTPFARTAFKHLEEFEALSKAVPVGRVGRPEEIASAVLWPCSPGASFVVGHALVVDGGQTVGTR